MTAYGIPGEVLSDNGKVFTGRFYKPGVPVEVMFDRICRENGITHRLTRPQPPTTTGKIERLHQTLRRELLEPHGPFETLEALQAGLDAWRAEYNGDRPHQSLAMAFPASAANLALLNGIIHSLIENNSKFADWDNPMYYNILRLRQLESRTETETETAEPVLVGR